MPKANPRNPPVQKVEEDTRERVAIFLGAGASKAFGYPLTGELLPDLLKYLEDGTLESWDYSKDERDLLSRGLGELLPGLRTIPRNELPLITDVLTLIDHSMATATSVLARWRTEDVLRLRGLIERVIADMVGPDGAGETPELESMATWVREAAEKFNVGIVTTNYDIELELALFEAYGAENVAATIDFGMSWREPDESAHVIYSRPARPKLSYFKLHGSLNWLRCALCEHIYINVAGVIVQWAWEPEESPLGSCHCGHWPLQSVLVTPSYVRDTRDGNLLAIWRNALDLLSAADRWVLIGYSLPSEDIAIRTLLLKAARIRGLSARPKLKIWVVQGDAVPERQRYQLMFPDATYHSGGLKTFSLASVLN